MEIDNNAFEGCSGLYTLDLPRTLMHISPNAFSFCDHLQTVQIQNRFMDIDETTFENTVNIIIKATQYSTSYEFAHQQNIRFTPAVFDEAHRIITSAQVAQLSRAGVMFQMKALDGEKAVIRFDQGQKFKIVQGQADENARDRNAGIATLLVTAAVFASSFAIQSIIGI